jgi:predicted enzyme related to lactoylglutathione lyase
MDWKLELVVVPVTDVERAKHFYSEQVDFVVDHDTRVDDDVHIVQLTPPGSGCSIAIATGMVKTPPGSVEGLQLVVPDIDAARTQLAERGVAVSQVALRGRHPRRRPRRPLELLHLLQRPRRQRLRRPGAPRRHLSGTGPPNLLL